MAKKKITPAQLKQLTKKSRSKYRNKPCYHDGIRFASQREGKRYLELRVLEKQGVIQNLELQPAYKLVVNGKDCGKYVADFRYVDVGSGKLVVEDTKGVRTQVYKLKKKLMWAIYDIDVMEV